MKPFLEEECGVTTIEMTPHHPNHPVRISFWVDSRDWSTLEASDEWKSFEALLLELQTQRIQQIRKGDSD